MTILLRPQGPSGAGMGPFKDRIKEILNGPLAADASEILQVNLGYRCNMSCAHCHVEAGAGSDRMMERETVDEVIRLLRAGGIATLDVTGGAPEMNPHFRYLVAEARAAGCHVMVRTNLTVFFEEGVGDMPEFLDRHAVEVIASLPCYTEEGVDRVRGRGTFSKSIEALKSLNSLGYGKGSGKGLNLVYNPSGAFLCASQKRLEEDYRRELGRYGISFDRLFTFTNMPAGRFRDFLVRTGGLDKYMGMLKAAFNPAALQGLMCRRLISVGWDGRLFNCDFNQVLGLGLGGDYPPTIREFDLARLAGRAIAVSDYCYACTAGQGST